LLCPQPQERKLPVGLSSPGTWKQNPGKFFMAPYKDLKINREYFRKRKAEGRETVEEKFSRKYSQLKNKATKRGWNFDLNKEQVRLILSQKCSYGNQIPAGGIDRKNNKLGYTIENSIPCCYRHNLIKNAWFSFEDMVKIISFSNGAKECKNIGKGGGRPKL
jgi:hypothetical protein